MENRAYVADLKIADKYSMLKQTNEVLSEDLQIHIIELLD